MWKWMAIDSEVGDGPVNLGGPIMLFFGAVFLCLALINFAIYLFCPNNDDEDDSSPATKYVDDGTLCSPYYLCS